MTGDLAVLEQAFRMGKPWAVDHALLHLRKLQGDLAGAPDWPRGARVKAEIKARITGLHKLLVAGQKNAHRLSDDGPTPETALKARRNMVRHPIVRLYRADKLSAEHVAAANSIEFLFHEITRAMAAGAQNLTKGAGTGFADLRLSHRVAEEHAGVYLPWAQDMGPTVTRLVIDVAVFGDAIRTVRRRLGMGFDETVALLRDALYCYAVIEQRWNRGHPSRRRYEKARELARVGARP